MEMTIDILEKVNKIYDGGCRKVLVTFNNGSSRAHRLFKSGDTIAYFGRRKRKSGFAFPPYNAVDVEPFVKNRRKTEEQKWEDGWTKVKNRLLASGLWGNIVEEINEAFAVGYNTLQEAYHTYWDSSTDDRVEEFLSRYPSLVGKRDDGTDYIRTHLLWTYHEKPTVKKMRFTKYRNEDDLERIQIAMDKKESFNHRGEYGYDISFEYNPDKNKAWYSEEYRGCGNGYYYLALDATHALFCEKD